MIQPDSNMSEFEAQEGAEFFINLVPGLDNRINTMVQQLKKPLTYIFPVDFQAHLQNAKSIDRIDQDWLENFKDVVALKIQGRINVPIIRLAQQLRFQFGGQSIFWLDVLCSFAQNEKYHQNLRIWQINDAYKTCLHLPIGEYEKNRHFRRLAKLDISSTKKLIASINQLSLVRQNEEASKKAPGDVLSKVQMNYKLHQESSRKVVQFLRSQKQKCLEFFDQNNLLYPGKKSPVSEVSNSHSKRTKEKDRQLFPKQKTITDFSVQMVDPKNTKLLKKINGKDEKPLNPQKILQLDRHFNNMPEQAGQMKADLPYLRKQFTQTKSKLFSRPQSVYVNLLIGYSYIQYVEYPNLIESSPFKYFDNPFEQHKDLIYDIDDYELYEEYDAEEISDSDEEGDQEDDDLDSVEKEHFYNEEDDGYDFDEEDRLVYNTAYRKTKLFAGNQWVYNVKDSSPFCINLQPNQINNYGRNTESNEELRPQNSIQKMINEFDATIICLDQTPMIVASDGKMSKQDKQKIRQIFHGKSKQQGMNAIHENDQLSNMFTYEQIQEIISTMTKKRVKNQEGKTTFVYLINESRKENNAKDQNMEKAPSVVVIDQDDGNSTEFDEPQTAAHDDDYRPTRGVLMNLESRSSSQRINNLKQVNANSQQQQKSQSSSLLNPAVSVTTSNPLSQKSRKQFLRESKLWSQETITNPPVSRLRPRNSKPNYNLSQLLSGSQKNNQAFEI